MQIKPLKLKETTYSLSFRNTPGKFHEWNSVTLMDETKVDLLDLADSLNKNDYSKTKELYQAHKIHPFIYLLFSRKINNLDCHKFFSYVKIHLNLPLDFKVGKDTFFEHLIKLWHEDYYSPKNKLEIEYKNPFILAYLKYVVSGNTVLNYTGQTPWMLLAYHRPLWFIENFPTDEKNWLQVDKNGQSLLFYLASSPHLGRCKDSTKFNQLPISQKMVNQLDHEGNPSYFYAMSKYNLNFLDFLIGLGGNLNHKNNAQQDILLYSTLHAKPSLHSYIKVLHYLKQHNYTFKNCKNDKHHYFNIFFTRQWLKDVYYINPYRNQHLIELVKFLKENFSLGDILTIKNARNKCVLDHCQSNFNSFILLYLLQDEYQGKTLKEWVELYSSKKNINYSLDHQETVELNEVYKGIIQSYMLKNSFNNETTLKLNKL